MSVSDELKDPWGWLVAGVSGGLGWAVLATPLGPAAIGVGLAIGAVVMGSKVAVGAARSGERKQPSDRLPEAPFQSPQGQFLTRARVAAQQIHALADRPSDPTLRAEVRQVDEQAETVVAALRDLAGRATLVDQALASANPSQVAQEQARLQEAISAESDPAVREERQRALASVVSQAESLRRLERLRERLLARAQAVAVDLEGLASRTGELVAVGTSAFDGDPASQILDDLTASLESVRTGLAEAEQVSRNLPET